MGIEHHTHLKNLIKRRVPTLHPLIVPESYRYSSVSTDIANMYKTFPYYTHDALTLSNLSFQTQIAYSVTLPSSGGMYVIKSLISTFR